jgi:carboxyl-terminal processing protease
LRPRCITRWLPVLFLLLGVAVLPAAAQTPTSTSRDDRREAQIYEQKKEWVAAATRYESLLRRDRDNPELRAAFVRSLRHVHLQRRHSDPSYAAVVQQMAPSQALDVYQQVLLIVPSVYLDQVRTNIPDLFASGVQELLYALEDDVFLGQYLSGVAGTDAFKNFRKELARLRDHRPGPATREQARDLVLGLGQLAQDLDLPVQRRFLVAIALEMAAGACNALDEYTLFLTPGSAANEALGIDVPVGVGLEVVAMGNDIVISRVYPKSPAAAVPEEVRFVRGSLLRSIDGQLVSGQAPEAVAALLRGEAGRQVVIEFVPPDGSAEMPRSVTLTRTPVVIPTVEFGFLGEQMGMASAGMPMTRDIGYLKITSFQHNTVTEVQEALAQLQSQGARAIVLDLRGNGGGLFDKAVGVAELFLPEGQQIVRGESPVDRFNKTFPVRPGNPLTLPLAVLIDGDTASAAEVVVGALKDQNRARLFGQPTFGKGLIQCIIPVTKPGPAGRIATALKITVARFFTPGKQPVNLRGITPHDVIDSQGEVPVEAARLYLINLLRGMNDR